MIGRGTLVLLSLVLLSLVLLPEGRLTAQDDSPGSGSPPTEVAGADGSTPHDEQTSSGGQQDELWEYSPYRVRVWLALEEVPVLSDRLRADLHDYLRNQAEIEAPATWKLTSRDAPNDYRSEMLHHLDRVSADSLLEDYPDEVDDREITKLMLAGVREEPDGYLIQVRELDCKTRRVGSVFRDRVGSRAMIGRGAFRLLVKAFSPITTIERAKGNEAELRLRAGGLIVQPFDPARLDAGDFLLPVVRNNDRYGNPREGGILVPPWTFLQVTERKGGDLACVVHSGLRNPVGGRSSARKERLALGVSPAHDSTRLLLRTRTVPPKSLSGFDVYAKDPLTEETELVGRSDWNGAYEIRREGPAMSIFYVRSGDALLARLPIVPGLERELTAEMVDDSIRLRAEGFVKNMQSELMDLVARRMLTASRLRKRLAEGDIEEAEKLFEQYKEIPASKALSARIRATKNADADADERTRLKVNRMYEDLEKLIVRFLGPGLQEELAKELSTARAASTAGTPTGDGSQS